MIEQISQVAVKMSQQNYYSQDGEGENRPKEIKIFPKKITSFAPERSRLKTKL